MALGNIDPDWDYGLEQVTPIRGEQQTSLWGIGISDLAHRGHPLMTVATRLSDQVANIFGEPDLGLTTPDGDLASTVRSEWAAGFREWLM